jgi:hypothetical protein
MLGQSFGLTDSFDLRSAREKLDILLPRAQEAHPLYHGFGGLPMDRVIKYAAPNNRVVALTFVFVLAAAFCSAHAQFFSDPEVDLSWQTLQTAQTFASPSGDLLCETPWDASWNQAETNSIQIDESLREQDGGCPLVTLSRSGNFSSSANPGTSTSLDLLFRIEALTSTEIDRIGGASGSMAGSANAWIQIDQWMDADVLIRFIADIGLENATTSLTAHFAGPIDPLSGQPILINEPWTGTTRAFLDMNTVLLAPGLYELHAEISGSFLPMPALQFAAQVSANALIDNPNPATPPPTWDLDLDGRVGLGDACLWATTPSDVDGNGTINQSDLEFLMALARAGGETVTDDDLDGSPDQCGNECAADFNNDGIVDFFDIQTYLSIFAAGDARADLNKDGILDFFDLLAFLNLFAAGCQDP